MASEKNDLNLAPESSAAGDSAGKGSGGMKKIILIVIALLVLGGGAAAGYFLLGNSGGAGATADGSDAAAEPEPERDPIYLALSPAFVVNFPHNGSMRYLQIELQIMAYDQPLIDKVESNMPAVRNGLIMLFSGQDYDQLNTVEGKEALRKQVLASINESIRAKPDNQVIDAFFTGFVMQ